MLNEPAQRFCIRNTESVLHWVRATQPPVTRDKTVIATFIIDTDQQLWIADRGSEHVVCAAGQTVLSAGEITFTLDPIAVVGVTNQSTGYCPEPESWWVVEHALSQAGIAHPTGFTEAYLFRQCTACGTTNIVKDGWFECAVCESPLSREWNSDQNV